MMLSASNQKLCNVWSYDFFYDMMLCHYITVTSYDKTKHRGRTIRPFVVVLLFNVHCQQLWSWWDDQLTIIQYKHTHSFPGQA